MSARQVQQALSALSETRSTATISPIHCCLTRAIERAEKHDLVRRNVISAPEARTRAVSKETFGAA